MPAVSVILEVEVLIESVTLRGPSARRTLALVCAIFLGVGVVLAGVGPALPHLAARSGQDIAALGGLFTAISGGVVLSQLVFGPLSDRLGLARVLAGGIVLMALGTLGVALSAALVAMVLCALLAGFGFGGILVGGNLLIAALFAARSAAALNGANLFFGVGSMLGPALAGLAGARLGFPQAALWVGAALLLALVPAVLLLAAPAPPPATPDAAPGERGRAGELWLLGLLLLFYTGTEVGFGGWVTVYLLRGAAFEPALGALVASGFWLALTAGRGLGALLGLRLAPSRLLALGLLGMLAGATLLTLSAGAPAPTIAGVLLFGLSCGPVFPTLMSVITTAARGSGARTGLALGIGNSGGLIIPALLGLLLSRYGPTAMAATLLGTASIMLALCAAVALAGRPPRPAAHASANPEA